MISTGSLYICDGETKDTQRLSRFTFSQKPRDHGDPGVLVGVLPHEKELQTDGVNNLKDRPIKKGVGDERGKDGELGGRMFVARKNHGQKNCWKMEIADQIRSVKRRDKHESERCNRCPNSSYDRYVFFIQGLRRIAFVYLDGSCSVPVELKKTGGMLFVGPENMSKAQRTVPSSSILSAPEGYERSLKM